MHTDSCMRAYATVQKLLCHGSYCELLLSLARASCRMSFATRPCCPSCCLNQTRRPTLFAQEIHPNPCQLMTVVSHKHDSIIRVGAGLIQFVYKSHSGLATEATRNKNPFSPSFARVFERSVECESVQQPRQCTLSGDERTWSTPTHADAAQLRMRRKDALLRDARRGNEMLVIGVAVTPRN